MQWVPRGECWYQALPSRTTCWSTSAWSTLLMLGSLVSSFTHPKPLKHIWVILQFFLILYYLFFSPEWQVQPRSLRSDLSFPFSRVEMQTPVIKTDRLERRNSRSWSASSTGSSTEHAYRVFYSYVVVFFHLCLSFFSVLFSIFCFNIYFVSWTVTVT